MGEVTHPPKKSKDSLTLGFNPMGIPSIRAFFWGQELDRLLARFMELVQQVQGSEAMNPGGVVTSRSED